MVTILPVKSVVWLLSYLLNLWYDCNPIWEICGMIAILSGKSVVWLQSYSLNLWYRWNSSVSLFGMIAILSVKPLVWLLAILTVKSVEWLQPFIKTNKDRTLDVVFSRFWGFSYTITLRQKFKRVTRRLSLSVS